jgi:hypothetical protein
MFIKLSGALFCGLLSFSNACGLKSDKAQTAPAGPPAGNEAAATKPALDVCSLVDKSEIAAVQGGQVESVIPSHSAGGEFNVSQCYYTVATAGGSKNFSVHLQVTQAAPNNPDRAAVKKFWDEKFNRRDGGSEREHEREGEAEVEPLPVAGVGDEALWYGDGRAGALYVLKKDKLVRVSVGGHADAKVRIEKSKALAAKALKRLP